MKERALVLGGGGAAGLAWEIGLAAGLTASGIDLSRAEMIVGTSAGAFAGAQLALGFPPQALADLHIDHARQLATLPPPSTTPNIDHLLEFLSRLPSDVPPSSSQMQEMGAVALAASTLSEADYFITHFSGMFGPDPVWPDRFYCTAVDALDGTFTLWSKRDGVPLERAVAASCSVPGAFPPLTIGSSRFMDGGVRSWTNADCAAGYARVLLVAVALPSERAFLDPMIARERAVIEATGALELIMPDARSLELFGDNTLLAPRGEEITRAGIAQGKREGERLQAFWG